MVISTVNVNGLRAAARKGFVAWLASCEAEVVCLQETRARMEQLAPEVAAPDGWHMVLEPADTPGRSGVAVLTRQRPQQVRVGFGVAEFDASGRYVEVDLPGVTVASLYLPSGEVGTERQDAKERFMAGFGDYLERLVSWARDAGRGVAVCGDWNIAHTERDLKNWRNNRRSSGFLPEEREWLGGMAERTGLVDVVRALHPDTDGPYSWWSTRGRAFDNDTGWRIDYQWASPDLAARAEWARVERAATHAERWSDHAPVTVGYRG